MMCMKQKNLIYSVDYTECNIIRYAYLKVYCDQTNNITTHIVTERFNTSNFALLETYYTWSSVKFLLLRY